MATNLKWNATDAVAISFDAFRYGSNKDGNSNVDGTTMEWKKTAKVYHDINLNDFVLDAKQSKWLTVLHLNPRDEKSVHHGETARQVNLLLPDYCPS